MLLRLGPAHQLMAPRLHLAPELQPGEEGQRVHQLPDQAMMHQHQGDRTMTLLLPTGLLLRLQLQPQPQGLERKWQRQLRPRERIENHSGITGSMHRRRATMPLHQPLAHRRRLHTEAITMHRLQPLGPGMGPDTSTAMKSNIRSVIWNCTCCPPSILGIPARSSLTIEGPVRRWASDCRVSP